MGRPSAYTAGPWHLRQVERRGVVIGLQVVAGEDERPVEVAEVRWPTPNLAANARLIATAPDLVEALRELVDRIDRDAARPEVRAALARAEEVLRRATGGAESRPE
ncbi:hypothetical protein HRbin12_01325 [bacterium HR12]|nr:hypothetical protein HRbin12_01325 [bacterium HR12]